MEIGTRTTEEIPRGAGDSIAGHTEVVPTQGLIVKQQARATFQRPLLQTNKAAAQGIAEGVGRDVNIAIN